MGKGDWTRVTMSTQIHANSGLKAYALSSLAAQAQKMPLASEEFANLLTFGHEYYVRNYIQSAFNPVFLSQEILDGLAYAYPKDTYDAPSNPLPEEPQDCSVVSRKFHNAASVSRMHYVSELCKHLRGKQLQGVPDAPAVRVKEPDMIH